MVIVKRLTRFLIYVNFSFIFTLCNAAYVSEIKFDVSNISGIVYAINYEQYHRFIAEMCIVTCVERYLLNERLHTKTFVIC